MQRVYEPPSAQIVSGQAAWFVAQASALSLWDVTGSYMSLSWDQKLTRHEWLDPGTELNAAADPANPKSRARVGPYVVAQILLRHPTVANVAAWFGVNSFYPTDCFQTTFLDDWAGGTKAPSLATCIGSGMTWTTPVASSASTLSAETATPDEKHFEIKITRANLAAAFQSYNTWKQGLPQCANNPVPPPSECVDWPTSDSGLAGYKVQGFTIIFETADADANVYKTVQVRAANNYPSDTPMNLWFMRADVPNAWFGPSAAQWTFGGGKWWTYSFDMTNDPQFTRKISALAVNPVPPAGAGSFSFDWLAIAQSADPWSKLRNWPLANLPNPLPQSWPCDGFTCSRWNFGSPTVTGTNWTAALQSDPSFQVVAGSSSTPVPVDPTPRIGGALRRIKFKKVAP